VIPGNSSERSEATVCLAAGFDHKSLIQRLFLAGRALVIVYEDKRPSKAFQNLLANSAR
jgi:hypothetical protein